MITVLLLSPSLDVTYLVDEVTVGEIHRPHTVLRSPGGKGLNLARAAHRRGEPPHRGCRRRVVRQRAAGGRGP